MYTSFSGKFTFEVKHHKHQHFSKIKTAYLYTVLANLYEKDDVYISLSSYDFFHHARFTYPALHKGFNFPRGINKK